MEEKVPEDDMFLSYNLIAGDFEEGYTLKIEFNDKYIIVNDPSVINEMK